LRTPRLLIGLAIAALASPAAAQTAERRYVAARDQARWSPGVNVGKPIEVSDTCYLIKHGTQWLL
jgi:N-acyl homoserine lactone hydrolase